MLKINKLVYYALKGMLAEDVKNLNTIVQRLGFLGEINPRLGSILTDGFAIDAKIEDASALCDHIGAKEKITDLRAELFTCEDLQQYIDVTYIQSGKKYHTQFELSNMSPEKRKMFAITYI